MNVTSVSDLKNYAQGQVVELPPFAEGQPFIARLHRPSILVLAKQGKIPNSLLTTANRLFAGNGINEKNINALPELLEVLDVMGEACFIQPTYSEIKESGVELTDEQMMFIFSYAQRGVKALETFRQQPEDNELIGDVTEVQEASL